MSPADHKAVFLSYAHEDATAARRIADALRAAGVEAWFDESELRGGEAWDATIRKQIRECALFIPIISAHTQARHEGYFRLEWRLADQRTHLMGKVKAFLLPVCIDDTRDSEADVPDSFLSTQWTRLPAELSPAAFVQRVQSLLCGPMGTSTPVPAVAPTSPSRPPAAPSVPVLTKSVAVLAFANLSHDPENEYFSDGITEELLNVLAKVPGLRVAARTSAFYFKGRSLPVRQIANELGVAFVVEGSVRKSGNRVRITAQLIKASDGYHVWSDRFDRELTDVFALQDEIAGLIAENLQLELGSAPRVRQKVNPEAHRLVLEGRHFVALRSVGFARAEKAFAQAVAIDSGFAPAQAGVAEVAGLRGLYELVEGGGPVDADFSHAKAAAARAMELDPTLAEPHAVLGLVLFMERRLEDSDRHFQQTLRLNPNYGIACHWYGLMLGVVGKFDLAVTALERAVELDPLAHTSLYTYGCYLYAARRLEESLSAVERAIDIAPAVPFYHSMRAIILLALGRIAEALTEARWVRHSPVGPTAARHWWADGDAIHVLHRAGAEQEAQEYLAKLEARLPANSHVFGYALCAVERFEDGLRLLETVEPMCQTRLYFMPMMEPLQATPALRQLFAALGSANEYERARTTLTRLRAESAGRRPDSASVSATPSPAAATRGMGR